jgi:hypothetical protein
MSQEPQESQPMSNANPDKHGRDPMVLERVQELTWAIVDEQISADEMRLLDNLLLCDDEARRTYIGCMQLHTDLLEHFSKPAVAAGATSTKSPVLGFLGEGFPGAALESPNEDAKS